MSFQRSVIGFHRLLHSVGRKRFDSRSSNGQNQNVTSTFNLKITLFIKYLIPILFFFVNVLLSVEGQEQTHDLFSDAPGEEPKIFGEGVVSVKDRYEYALSISPDGNQILFKANDINGHYTLNKVDGKWNNPSELKFRDPSFWEYEAFFNSSGDKIYFTSRDSEESGANHFYYAEKTESGWSEGKFLDTRINRTQVMWCTFTADDTMYYGNMLDFKIYSAKRTNRGFARPVNTGITGMHPTVAPDESFILFNSSRLGGQGRNDLFVVFRNDDNSWSEPQNLGSQINTDVSETCPTLSPDGNFLFFSRYNDLNGKSNIYWVDTSVIETIRPKTPKSQNNNM